MVDDLALNVLDPSDQVVPNPLGSVPLTEATKDLSFIPGSFLLRYYLDILHVWIHVRVSYE